uniref:Ribonuclease H n=1 Tax=Magnetococcus massalia (strain MO-1) TaxID=451514 RepID=A0A1S7LLL8_MAGMO|nr:Ribonuclease H [Candidatus Magnetococcus massalia]
MTNEPSSDHLEALTQQLDAQLQRIQQAAQTVLDATQKAEAIIQQAKQADPAAPLSAAAVADNATAQQVETKTAEPQQAALDLDAVDAPIVLYTDGACSGNPGPGGWGVHGRFGREVRNQQGWSPDTTNNRMEMLAAIHGLEVLPEGTAVELVTDSQYVKNGITKWIHGWKRKGWKKSDGKPVLNMDLWKRLDAASAQRKVKWSWIKGHAGHEGNEMADQLAVNAISQGRSGALEADPAG